MPRAEPTAALPPELVLAAIDRAQRHETNPTHVGVPRHEIAPHLGRSHSSWTTRLMTPALEALEADGLVELGHRHSAPVWALSEKGRRRLAALKQAGSEAIQLPESPQHRDWREAREASRDRIEEFRESLRTQLEQAALLLGVERPSSDDWFEAGTRLRDACRCLGVALHCLYEWSEPDDARPDPPPARPGARNIRDWD